MKVYGEFKVAILCQCYFIFPPKNDKYPIYANNDDVCSDILYMHVVKYRRILTQQFNGLFKQSGIFFYKEKQAQQAVDWANQTLLALKLAGIV